MTRKFGPYELEALLGRGGMGEVHRAVDTRKGRTVALKLLPAAFTGDPEIEARFRREAEVAARLSDPHVIPIHDYGEVHGRLFLDMRFVEGTDLAKALTSTGAFAPARAVTIVSQIAGALDSAHQNGLVHRDVKPSNILLSAARPGREDFAYLVDFGVAAGAATGTRLTANGQTVGTAAYMAPERFAEDRESDPRIDVYALGCVLYELLTGHVAFDGTNFPRLMYQHLNEPPPVPSRTHGLPTGFDPVIATALAKNPDDRFPTAGALADAAWSALRGPRSQPITSRPMIGPPLPAAPSASSGPGPRPSGPLPGSPPPGSPPPGPPPPWSPTSRVPGLAPNHGPALTSSGPEARGGWRLVSAIMSLVIQLVWLAGALGGAGAGYSRCGSSSAACASGTAALFAALVTAVGIGFAIRVLARRQRRRWALTVSWSCFGAAFILVIAAALLDGAVR